MDYSFLHASYHPVLVLVTGVLVFFGFCGVGEAIARASALVLPLPWRTVVAALLGIQAIALCVELAAMAGMATRLLLLSLGVGLLVAGAAWLWIALSRLRVEPRSAQSPFAERGAAAILVVAIVALASMLLTAMAPSSKIDEIYYHMLTPARIAAEGTLTFYREPWEGAIWPHMAFQVAQAPLHALGVPDAGNVAGWCLGALLVLFAWEVVGGRDGDASWRAAFAASFCVGMYPAIWHVTAGSHAMGDLALAAAVVALMQRDQLAARIGPVRLAALVSVLALSAATSKITLLPVSLVLLVILLWALIRSGGVGLVRSVAVAIAVPWAMFFLPIACWTAWVSGSPFGPVLSDLVPASVYGTGMSEVFRETREANALSLTGAAFDMLAGTAPVVWLGLCGALFCRELPARDRAIAAGLLAFQVLVIAVFAFPSTRFLGGLHYGLAIWFAAAVSAPPCRIPAGATRTAAALVLLAPWLAVQVYYAAQFFPVSTGLQAREAFYAKYIAFYRDFVELDRFLPPDAVILCAAGFRPGSVYSPRPVFFNAADVPRGRPAYGWIDPQEQPETTIRALAGFARGDRVYGNQSAVVAAFRTPGRAQERGPMEVVQLVRR